MWSTQSCAKWRYQSCYSKLSLFLKQNLRFGEREFIPPNRWAPTFELYHLWWLWPIGSCCQFRHSSSVMASSRPLIHIVWSTLQWHPWRVPRDNCLFGDRESTSVHAPQRHGKVAKRNRHVFLLFLFFKRGKLTYNLL